jgi:hypothetical protein
MLLYAALGKPHPEHSRRDPGTLEPVQKRQCGRMWELWVADVDVDGHDS